MSDPSATPRRGWSSHDLQVVSTLDPRYWSTFDAATVLGPPVMTEEQVRDLIKLTGLEPVGKRYNGPRRRHIRVYWAVDLIKAHEKLAGLTHDACQG